jgi:hypothetical protein
LLSSAPSYACPNSLQVEVITSDFDFIRSSGNPGSSPGTTFFCCGRGLKLLGWIGLRGAYVFVAKGLGEPKKVECTISTSLGLDMEYEV